MGDEGDSETASTSTYGDWESEENGEEEDFFPLSISRASSFGSIDQELQSARERHFSRSSEELDRLSQCLSECREKAKKRMDFERDFPPLLPMGSPSDGSPERVISISTDSPPSSIPTMNSPPSTIHELDLMEEGDEEEDDELMDGDSLMSPGSIPSPTLQYRSSHDFYGTGGGPDTAQLLEFVNSRLSSVEQNDFGSDITSMASSDSKEVSTSLFYDVIQVALWTCVFSLLYSYAWRQHRKKFILSIFLIVPTVFTACCVISGLLTTMVVLGRLFSTPYTYTDFINFKDKLLPAESEEGPVGRKRTLSGASTISWHSEQDLLPRPLCRRHSTSNGSVNGSRPPSRKLSYCYSHFSAENGGAKSD